ncbi:ABC transporter permease [Deinococcus cellulosilyticus]|uniref:ABC transporter permease n=1 Tax=Deinococcus cellulosilyticus (strain DSM 18568 / NBRC 106333 / KACC 11606 / 5516J-15) TaxID=1223518 RepID=A0A511MVC5_DEIC1|nr:ABC transporter permease [Deinococcus cellulosilyticus]GEM44534.1 ABC transporter permease [Deinococcus cellulosilyticus NBRC 106333 = KACC 11606]
MSSTRTTSRTHPSKPSRRSIGPGVIFRIAWKAIIGNPLRSALTVLGVVIGVAAVVALVMIGQGSTSNITRSLESLGTNLLTVGPNFGGRNTGGGGIVRSGDRQSITMKDVEALQRQLGTQVAGIAPVSQGRYQIKFGKNNLNVQVTGTWPDYSTVRNSAVEKGAFFTQTDVDTRKRTAVIGYGVAQDLLTDVDPIGQKIRIGGISFTVVGVLPDKGDAGFSNANYSVLIPLSTFQKRLSRSSTSNPTVSNIYIQGPDQKTLKDLQNTVTEIMAAQHEQSDPTSYDFQVQNQADALESVNQVSQTLTLFLGGVAGISLLVGGIGIMNIMLVSVTERTREIGIRKALGAKPRDILTQFLTESVVLSVGGGLLGIAIGLGLANGVGKLLNITPVMSPTSMLLAFSFSVVVGVFFGYYPASRAARLDPVDSLRYE